MQLDGYLVTRQAQPLHGLSWPGAAARFVQTRGEFLRFDNQKLKNIIGKWSVVCFPVKGCTNKPVGSFSQAEIGHIRSLIMGAKRLQGSTEFATVNLVEQFFKSYLEYPPYALDDDWDGQAMRRRKWAENLFKQQMLVIA